jgi:hypothetical protein
MAVVVGMIKQSVSSGFLIISPKNGDSSFWELSPFLGVF